jgi:hypothetical protein
MSPFAFKEDRIVKPMDLPFLKSLRYLRSFGVALYVQWRGIVIPYLENNRFAMPFWKRIQFSPTTYTPISHPFKVSSVQVDPAGAVKGGGVFTSRLSFTDDVRLALKDPDG